MADEKREVTTVFRVDVSQFKKNLATANASIKLSKAQFEATTAAMDDWSKSSDGLEAKIKQLADETAAQTKIQRTYAEQLEETAKAKEQNIEQAEDLRKALADIEKAGKGSGKEAKQLAKELATLEKEIAKAEKAETELTVKMLKAEAAASKSKKEMDAYGDQLKELQKDGSGVDDTMGDIADSIEEAAEVAEDAGDGFTVLKGTLANLTSQAVIKGLNLIADAGKAIAASFKDAVGAADSLKSATNDFSSSTGLDTTAEPGYQEAIKNVYGDNLGEDYADIANSMATIKQTTGEIDPTKLEGLTKNALMLRDAFGFDVQEQMRAVDMLMTQFGLDSATAFNLVAQGAQNGLNKNGDLLDTINEYSVHYKQLGYDAEDMFNSLANGAAAGTFSVDKLGDAMKEFGIRAKDGSSGSLEAFATLGLDGERMTAQFAAGGAKAEAATKKVIKTLLNMKDPVAQNTAGVALFGTMWEDLGIEGIKALTNMDGAISNTVDAMEQINEVKYDNLKSAWSGFGRIIETNVAVPIGQKALPLISTFVNKLSTGFREADGDAEAMAKTMGDAASEMVAGFSAQIPTIVAAAQQFIPAFLAGIAPATPMLATAAGDIIFAVLDGLLMAIPELAPAAASIISTLIISLLGYAPELVQAGLTLLLALIDALPLFIEQLTPQIPIIVTSIIEALIAAAPQLLAAGIKLLGAILLAIPSINQDLARAIPGLIKTIVVGLGKGVQALVQAGKDLIRGLIQGMLGSVGEIGEAIGNIGKKVLNGFKNFFDINSPSGLLRDKIGKMLPPGIAVGVDSAAGVAIRSVKKLGQNLLKNIDISGVSDKLNTIKEAFTGGTLKVVGEGGPAIQGGGNNTTNNKSVTYAPVFKYNKPLNSKEIYRQNKNMLNKIVGVEE